MKLFVDIISGDELASDSYKYTKVFGDAGLEFRASYRIKKGDQIIIASDEEEVADDGEGEKVIDIVDASELSEIKLSKK